MARYLACKFGSPGCGHDPAARFTVRAVGAPLGRRRQADSTRSHGALTAGALGRSFHTYVINYSIFGMTIRVSADVLVTHFAA
jgi:hypothetical protein